MIALLDGIVAEKGENTAIIEVAGIGYEVRLPAPAFFALRAGERIRLYTIQVIREDAHELFAFPDQGARLLFKRLVGVSGVGPRTAIQVMSIGSTGEILAAIDEGDVARLTSLPGIGAKTAQKIILELRGKLAAPEAAQDADVIEALTGLGYNRNDAAKAVAALPPEAAGDEARLKAALRLLSKNR